MAIKKPHKYRFVLLQKLGALAGLVARDKDSPAFTPSQHKLCAATADTIADLRRRLGRGYATKDLQAARHWLDHEWPKVWERIQSAHIPPERLRGIRKGI